MADSFIFSSESVTEGHPDKVADQISDSVLDAILKDDPMGRVACEVLVSTGFARSIRQARQLVTHGHILVNGKKVDIPSFGVKVNDVISLKEKTRTNPLVESNFNGLVSFSVPYLEKDKAQFSAKLVREPMREELPIDVTEILAVELYSK